MKTTIFSLFTASLLSLAAIASGRLLDAADLIAIAFTTGLVAWTVAQYSATPRALTKARCVYLPINASRAPVGQAAVQQVA